MSQRTRIKICGVTSIDSALAAADAGADAIGLVFANGSPRCIDIDSAMEIADVLPPFVTAIGVFQLRTGKEAEIEEWWCEWAQLHGDEDESIVAAVAESHRIVRGLPFDEKQVKRWNDCKSVDALLLDGAAAGSGKPFDHSPLASLLPRMCKPVILAGGLTSENVGEAIRAVRPYAVDVSSGVESSPGVKDAKLIERFCAAVHKADAACSLA